MHQPTVGIIYFGILKEDSAIQWPARSTLPLARVYKPMSCIANLRSACPQYTICYLRLLPDKSKIHYLYEKAFNLKPEPDILKRQ